jgi:hypothetical protein
VVSLPYAVTLGGVIPHTGAPALCTLVPAVSAQHTCPYTGSGFSDIHEHLSSGCACALTQRDDPCLLCVCRCSQAGKPGARKRKLGAAAGGGSMDVLPTNLIMSTGFKPPKVRHLG